MKPRYMSVKCRYVTRVSHTQCMHSRPLVIFPSGTQISASQPTHAGQPTRTKFSNFPPNSEDQTYTLFDIHVNANNINPTDKMNVVLTLVGLPQRSQP